jgi:hypothetical protein
MQLDAFIFKLLLLSIPGFISYAIFRKIAVYRRASKTQFGFTEVLLIIILSLASCTIYDLSVMQINKVFKANYAATINKLVNVEIYNAKEMMFLCIIAIVLGLLLSLFESKKIIYNIAKKLEITNYYGDTDVWTSFCANKDTNWIYVRDHKLKLVYFGSLEQYSDPGEERELLLANVLVFSEDGEYCYDSPKMYICRQSDDITLEIPMSGEGEKNGKVHDKTL